MADALPIAIDAMGGDNAPREIVRGALAAADSFGCDVVLVGVSDLLEREILAVEGAASSARARISVVHAPEVIGMAEHPAAAVRQKKQSSIVRTCELVAQRQASAAVSAGNSGATLAAGLLVLHRSPGVARPALGTLVPTRRGRCFLLDVGANVDCKPEWLVQFAVMGSVYATSMLGVARPRVALLSNGREAGKGNELVQKAHELMQEAPIEFAGNIEGTGVFEGAADVVVCDGFAGNIALKIAEGVGEYLFASMRDEAMTSVTGRIGGALLKPRLRAIRERADYRRTGGALLLGVAGEVVIAHGRSDALAVQNAVRVAHEAVTAGVSGRIAEALHVMPVAAAPVTTTR